MSTKLLFSLAITAILTLTGCGGDGGGSDSGSNSSGGSENNLNLGGEANTNITFDTIIKDSAGKFVSFETDTENLTTVATETTTPNKNDNTFIAARSYFDKSLNADAGGFGNEIIERLPPDILIGNQWKEVESVAYELSQDNKTINMFYKGTNLKELQATIKLTAYDLKGDADIDIKDNNARKFALSFTPEDKAIRYAMQVSKEGVIANLGEETDISIDNFISKRRLGGSGKLSESLQFDTSNKTIVNVDDGNKVIGTYTATSSSASSPAMLTFKFNNAELKTMHGLGNKDDIEVLFVELGGKVYQAGKKHPANYNANAYNEVVKNRLEAMLKNEFYVIAAQGQLKIKKQGEDNPEFDGKQYIAFAYANDTKEKRHLSSSIHLNRDGSIDDIYKFYLLKNGNANTLKIVHAATYEGDEYNNKVASSQNGTATINNNAINLGDITLDISE